MARERGIPNESMNVEPYDTEVARPPVKLIFEAVIASPQCGLWPEDVSGDWRNHPFYNFGCSTQQNFAEMLDDPRDLEGPHASDPRYDARRDTVFGKYARGEPTAAQSSDEEAGKASNIGN